MGDIVFVIVNINIIIAAVAFFIVGTSGKIIGDSTKKLWRISWSFWSLQTFDKAINGRLAVNARAFAGAFYKIF